MNVNPSNPAAYRNLVYAELPSRQLLLDLYRPDSHQRVPVVIYFHNGGWRSGSKDICKVRWLTDYGFAVVSVNYRLLPRHVFPDQVRDAKAAVRFIRSRADDFGLEPEQIAAAGVSSGAYLANMLGVTAGHPELDRPSPSLADTELAGVSTHVNAVVNYHGFTDFLALQKDVTRRGQHRAARSPEARLLGHAVAENLTRAKLSSPISHVRPGLPPFLHIHGDRDTVTPLDQTRRFHAALQQSEVTSKFNLIRGAGHHSRQMFDRSLIRDRVSDFLHRHLETRGIREFSADARSYESLAIEPGAKTHTAANGWEDSFVIPTHPRMPVTDQPLRRESEPDDVSRSAGSSPAPPTKAWPYDPTPVPPSQSDP